MAIMKFWIMVAYTGAMKFLAKPIVWTWVALAAILAFCIIYDAGFVPTLFASMGITVFVLEVGKYVERKYKKMILPKRYTFSMYQNHKSDKVDIALTAWSMFEAKSKMDRFKKGALYDKAKPLVVTALKEIPNDEG